MKKVLVLDHGNGKMKMRSETVDNVSPSAIALKKDLGESLINKKNKLKTYEIESTEYVWGKDVMSVKGVIATYGFQNRYKSKAYKVLTSIAIAELALKSKVSPTDEVIVITGVPSSEIGTAAMDDIKAAYGGLHTVKIEGQTVKVNVDEVIVMPQPVGTVMSLYLDNEGFIKDEKYEEMRVGIIDIGTGTTDLDSVNGLSREKESTSVDYGMRDVYEIIAQYVNKQNPNAKAEYYHIEPFFTEGVYKISERHVIDFKEEKERAIEEVAEKLNEGIKRAWKTFDRFDEIIVTGGGAAVFAEHISNLVGGVTVAKKPQQANAEGFYKYGVYKVSEEDGE